MSWWVNCCRTRYDPLSARETCSNWAELYGIVYTLQHGASNIRWYRSSAGLRKTDKNKLRFCNNGSGVGRRVRHRSTAITANATTYISIRKNERANGLATRKYRISPVLGNGPSYPEDATNGPSTIQAATRRVETSQRSICPEQPSFTREHISFSDFAYKRMRTKLYV